MSQVFVGNWRTFGTLCTSPGTPTFEALVENWRMGQTMKGMLKSTCLSHLLNLGYTQMPRWVPKRALEASKDDSQAGLCEGS